MRKSTAEEDAYKAVLEMIIMHKFPPGSSVTEVRIAEMLGMSRTPVRSALKRLASDGLLEYALNKGCYVPFLTRKDLDKLFDFRLAIEPICARDAALNCNDEDREKMNALIEEEERCVREEPELLHIVNDKIHNLVVEIADNPYYRDPITRANWRTQLYLFFFDSFYTGRLNKIKSKPKGDYKSQVQHLELYNAISRHDTDSAMSIMHEHVSLTYKFLTSKEWDTPGLGLL